MTEQEFDDEPTPLEDLLEYLVRPLVKNPDEVLAFEEEGVLEFQVAPEDRGYAIGRNGRTIRSLRTIVAMAESTLGKAATVELIN